MGDENFSRYLTISSVARETAKVLIGDVDATRYKYFTLKLLIII